MELEMMVLGIIIGVISTTATTTFLHIKNGDEFVAPIEFFRLKVFQTKVCLSCDNLYHDSEQSCPLCFEKESIPLRKYFSPLTPLSITKKEEKDGTINYTLSMVSSEKYLDPSIVLSIPDEHTSPVVISHYPASTNQPSRFASDYSPEPPTARTGEGYNYSRVGMESKGSFLKGCCRAHAGYAKLITFIKDGFILSGKEHTRRV